MHGREKEEIGAKAPEQPSTGPGFRRGAIPDRRSRKRMRHYLLRLFASIGYGVFTNQQARSDFHPRNMRGGRQSGPTRRPTKIVALHEEK